jgi:hypothetical protein
MRAKQRHGLIAVLGENSKDLGNALVRPPPLEARRLGNCITDHGIIGKKGGYLSSWVIKPQNRHQYRGTFVL